MNMTNTIDDAYRTPEPFERLWHRPNAKRFWCAAGVAIIGYIITMAGGLMMHRLELPIAFCTFASGLIVVLMISPVVDQRLKGRELTSIELLGLLVVNAAIIVDLALLTQPQYSRWYFRPTDILAVWAAAYIGFAHVSGAIKRSLVEVQATDDQNASSKEVE